ncbi:MAG: peptide deformylase [Chloroflexi bacterium]|nr:peptide deformylase [Chloroflexota bacterium]MBP8054380.1 peptide deformylase [Chloroflexota bacterium]
MPKLDVLTPKDPILRRKARPVIRFDSELQSLIDNMIETMREAKGVGLAAPQIGQPLRLAVIETPPDIDEDGKDIEGTQELFVIINPEITWKSSKMIQGIEGCLSIPGWVGEVERHEAVRVKGLDRRGRKVSYRLTDYTARIFQHEVDHLEGVLYIDRLTGPNRFWTEKEYEEMVKKQDEEREKREKEKEVAPMMGN